MDVPKNCRVVVIGAGIAGTSVAYHLTALGWKDVVVLDQGPLFKTGGSTSHAPGLVFVVNFSKLMSQFAQYTTELYKSLELDGDPVWHAVGGMEIAWTPDRLEDLKRKTDAGKAWGIDTYLLGKDEARKKIPLLSDQIYGAMYTPADGIAEPYQAAEAMAKSAMRRGARFFGSTKVAAIHTKNGKVTGVGTDRGTIATENIVCAAGIWGPRVSRMAGVTLPLQPMRHQFALTESIPEMEEEVLQYRHPVLRHQDRAMYFRQEGKSYIIGSYDHEPLLVDPDNILSHEAAPIMPSLMEWSDDAFVNAVIRESTTVWADLGLQEKTGIRPGPIPNLEWAQTTKIDIEELKKVYVNELFENTEAYIGNLDPKDLNRDIDIEGKGRALKRVLIGTRVSDILLTLSIHSANHIGEIASQKGTQGLQGYSF